MRVLRSCNQVLKNFELTWSFTSFVLFSGRIRGYGSSWTVRTTGIRFFPDIFVLTYCRQLLAGCLVLR